ncbi:MAG: peptidoglycan DD-metalloendopeptidase family protein [Ardenticatenaceae bacterium]|nr:peptidoglycan DD-metalloendopeptidase family protein [Ardenticatenaceae bacterium]MCB9446396.1 peptidoglycan DD-metalloendopeptidase family protein [Ardenticatenaceae bacterium]
MKRRFWFFPLILMILLGGNGRIHAQSIRTHIVQPGDTWTALAWRYGIAQEDLQSAYPHPNQQRQPVIGSTLLLPDTGKEFTGQILRLNGGGLLETAVTYNLSPWQLAQLNGLPNPYTPTLYRPIFIPGGTEPVRELPVGFTSLELSHTTPQPGWGLAFRGQTSQPTNQLTNQPAFTAHLDSIPFDCFSNGRYQIALIGIDDFYKNRQPELTIQPANQPLWSQPWQFVDGDWTYNQITLTGTAAAITQEQIQAERARLFELWEQASPAPQWSSNFQLPITSYLEITSLYGARRSYNGGPYSSSHEGVDFAAYGGTAVYAPAAGTIAIAEPLTVRGNAVIIDHGLGIYSGYYHMSAISVAPGDHVEPGQQVGAVGTTGFSTGNHLHWDFLVAGQWVDALAWANQDMGCWVLAGWGAPCE